MSLSDDASTMKMDKSILSKLPRRQSPVGLLVTRSDHHRMTALRPKLREKLNIPEMPILSRARTLCDSTMPT